MINYIITLVFVLSTAAASGSILISTRLRNTCKAEFFTTVIYLQIFYFTYGFYAIWGQVIVSSFLSPYLTPDVLHRVTNILVLIGSPFVVFTWLMLMRLARELSGRKIRSALIAVFVAGNTLVVAALGYFLDQGDVLDLFSIIRYSFVLLNFIFTITAVIYLLSVYKKKAVLHREDTRNISIGLLALALIQNGLLLLYQGNIYIALGFILVFFLGGAFIPVYLRYQSDLSVFQITAATSMTFDTLCKRYDISPREKEIMQEICNGLSNQQIADRLYISLQTVKDHTSRIYFKTNCSSRAQLITMVNGRTQ
jgi:DNA-binding CsgD family transcriptional regulator